MLLIVIFLVCRFVLLLLGWLIGFMLDDWSVGDWLVGLWLVGFCFVGFWLVGIWLVGWLINFGRSGLKNYSQSSVVVIGTRQFQANLDSRYPKKKRNVHPILTPQISLWEHLSLSSSVCLARLPKVEWVLWEKSDIMGSLPGQEGVWEMGQR